MSFRKRKDGYWIVDYRDSNGQKHSHSFGKDPDGKKRAKEFDLQIKLKKVRGEELSLKQKDGVYIDELCQLWVDDKKAQGRKMGWIKDWVSVFNNYFAPDLAEKPCAMITQADIMKVIGVKYQGSSQSTRNRYVGYLRSIFQFGLDHGYIQSNPLGIWKKGKEVRRNSALTLNDLKKIQKYSPDHLAWAIEVAWNIPVRPGVSDLFTLRYDTNVDYSGKKIIVFHTKVGKKATIKCSNYFIGKINESEKLSKSGYLIEYKGKPVTHLRSALARAAGPKGAGLSYSVCMYDIRHLWITTMLNQGIEPSTIAYLSGTSVRMILKNYYEPHSADRAKASKVLPRL